MLGKLTGRSAGPATAVKEHNRRTFVRCLPIVGLRDVQSQLAIADLFVHVRFSNRWSRGSHVTGKHDKAHNHPDELTHGNSSAVPESELTGRHWNAIRQRCRTRRVGPISGL